MSPSIEFPVKCQECAKYGTEAIDSKCDFCINLELQEETLCHLNRCIQDPIGFKCYAFQPKLKLITPLIKKKPDLSINSRKTFDKLLDFDKIKYERALALQRLKSDPDGLFCNIKYHLMWNVIYRNPVFNLFSEFDSIHIIFLECYGLVRGLVKLLWLAPDHVHLYVESDGEKSVEEMAQQIKQFSQNAILKKFPDIKEKLFEKDEIWDKAYFSQSVG